MTEPPTSFWWRGAVSYTHLALRAAQAAVERINADTGLGLGALNAEDYDWETLPNPFLGSSNRKLYGLWANDDRCV